MGYSADFFIAHFGGNVWRIGVTYWRSPPVKSSKSNIKIPITTKIFNALTL